MLQNLFHSAGKFSVKCYWHLHRALGKLSDPTVSSDVSTCHGSHGWWMSVMGPSLSSDQAHMVTLQKKPKQDMCFLLGKKKKIGGNGIMEILGHGSLLLTKVIWSLQRFIRKREWVVLIGGGPKSCCQLSTELTVVQSVTHREDSLNDRSMCGAKWHSQASPFGKLWLS